MAPSPWSHSSTDGGMFAGIGMTQSTGWDYGGDVSLQLEA